MVFHHKYSPAILPSVPILTGNFSLFSCHLSKKRWLAQHVFKNLAKGHGNLVNLWIDCPWIRCSPLVQSTMRRSEIRELHHMIRNMAAGPTSSPGPEGRAVYTRCYWSSRAWWLIFVCVIGIFNEKWITFFFNQLLFLVLAILPGYSFLYYSNCCFM